MYSILYIYIYIYIYIEGLIIPINLNWFYRNFYMKIPFTVWMNILNFKNIKYIYI